MIKAAKDKNFSGLIQKFVHLEIHNLLIVQSFGDTFTRVSRKSEKLMIV